MAAKLSEMLVGKTKEERATRRVELLARKAGKGDLESYVGGLETKAGVFLGHISIMIAVTSILFAITEKGSWLATILGFELVLYLFLALFCIFIQREIPVRDMEDVMGDQPVNAGLIRSADLRFLAEAVKKEAYFRFVHIALYVLTIPLALTIIIAISAGAWDSGVELPPASTVASRQRAKGG